MCGQEKSGFDFLGFNIRQYKVSKNQSKLGFKTKIKPTVESIKSHYFQIWLFRPLLLKSGSFVANLYILKSWYNSVYTSSRD